MQYCNVIIYSYHYLLDPKIAERVSRELSKDCIVVFDEAHNIDNVCIESLSTDITEDSLRKATRGAHNLERRVAELKDTDQEKLRNEYEKLVEGLRGAEESRREDAFMANPGMDFSNRIFFFSGCFETNSRGSIAGRSFAGSCTRKYPKSRTFRCISEAIYRIPQGKLRLLLLRTTENTH